MPEGIVGATSPDLFREWFDRFVKKPTPISLSSPEQPDLSLRKDYTPTAPPPMLSRPPELSPGAAPEQAPIDAYTPEAPGATITDRFMSGLKKFGEAGQNLSDPAKMGLLGTGLAMLATPPRREPYSNTEILGRSGLAGLGIYEKALEDKRRQRALDISEEEHRLTREDQSLYRKGLLADKAERTALELKKEETQRIIREANAQRARAQAGRVEDLRKSVPREYLDWIGMVDVPDMTWEQFNKSQGATAQAMKPEPTVAVTGDTGATTILPKVAGRTYPNTGKTKTQPAGAKGGKPTALAEKLSIAEKSLQEKYPDREDFTQEEITKHARELFPTAGEAKPAKTSSLRPGANAPLPGYILDPKGRTVGGKKVWVSPDGKMAVVEK